MKIVQAQNCDIAVIASVLRECVRHMTAQGSDQWDDVYPNTESVAEDVRSRSAYMAMDDSACIGAITLNEVQEPEYRSILWLTDSPRVLVVHRLAVRPELQGRGIAGRLMDFAEDFAVANGYASIRLDAYTGNPRALALYDSRGYVRTGQVYFPRRILPFYCYEKVLSTLK